jgi:hypothetical protein
MKIKDHDFAIIQAIHALSVARALIRSIPDGISGLEQRLKMENEMWDMNLALRENINVEYTDY